MVVKRGGLGRNLSALLGTVDASSFVLPAEEKVRLMELAIDELQAGKYQPRQDMNEASLAELAESIKKQGLLQPLVVREIGPARYEILAGERRWRACRLIGMTSIPVVVRQVDDETAIAIALVENLQRDDLNAMEEARAMHRLSTEFNLTHQEVADLLSKSRTAVSNALRLLSLCEDVQPMLERGDIEMGHARCLLTLNSQEQLQVAQWVISRQLSVRETEALVARLKAGHLPSVLKKESTTAFEAELQGLAKRLKTKIYLKPGKAGKGRLVIHYEDEKSLEQLLGQLVDVNQTRDTGRTSGP
jgi:ParB family chromosome partitioning protein